jgi:hypothetical protein
MPLWMQVLARIARRPARTLGWHVAEGAGCWEWGPQVMWPCEVTAQVPEDERVIILAGVATA